MYNVQIRKPKKPPPITIPSPSGGKINLDALRTIIRGATIQFHLRLTVEGVKVVPLDVTAHKAITKVLLDKNLHYYTHPLEEDKPKRFVLYGLEKFELEEMRKKLADAKIVPTEIKYMFVKAPKFTEQCNYILYFKHNDCISLEQLKLVKAIDQVLVGWAHYRTRVSGISCCRKCLGWGHGSNSCSLQVKCVVCAQPHMMADCPLIKQKREGGHEQINQKFLKCGNCGGNHTATYKECPARQAHIEKIKTNRPPRYTNSRDSSRKAPKPPTLTQDHFPMPVYGNPAYQQPPVAAPTYAEKLQHTHKQGADLFTMDECKSIMNEFCKALQSCTTKVEQARVIADYALKYFTNFP